MPAQFNIPKTTAEAACGVLAQQAADMHVDAFIICVMMPDGSGYLTYARADGVAVGDLSALAVHVAAAAEDGWQAPNKMRGRLG